MQRLQRLREEAAAQRRDQTAEHGEVPPTAPAVSAVEINQLRASVGDLQRERDRLRSEVTRQRAEESRPLDKSALMSTLIDQGDTLSRGNGYNPLA